MFFQCAESTCIFFVNTLISFYTSKQHSDQGPSLQDWQARLDITRPQLLSKHSPKLLSLLFDYWKQRRFVDNCGRPLQPNLRVRFLAFVQMSLLCPLFVRQLTHIKQNEDVSLKPDSDPYVCFRRRELKPQRKLRRDDGQSLEKLKKLRDELLKAKELLELVALRETTRKESLALDMQLFEQKCVVRKLRKKLGLPCIEKDWDTAPLVRPRKNLLKKGPFGRGSEEKESSTKIRIPMRKIRDAANLVTDLDPSGQYSVLALTTEENVKKKKLTEEKDGLMDVTEVYICFLLSMGYWKYLNIFIRTRTLPLRHAPVQHGTKISPYFQTLSHRPYWPPPDSVLDSAALAVEGGSLLIVTCEENPRLKKTDDHLWLLLAKRMSR